MLVRECLLKSLYPEGLAYKGEVVQREDVTDETDTSYFFEVIHVHVLTKQSVPLSHTHESGENKS